jgi:LmbE family N-acetylglucosaminyl deacetylase
MRIIFISPHLDDAVLSCGGIINNLTRKGQTVEIWTVFAGDPPDNHFSPFALSLHNRWQLTTDTVRQRRNEDINACKLLNTGYRHFDFPDCVYRTIDQNQPLVEKEEDLFQNTPGSQKNILIQITQQISNFIKKDDILISPLAIGGHIDHHIVKDALKKIKNIDKYYYQDYPYQLNEPQANKQTSRLTPMKYNISQADIDQWQTAISMYRSQISTFWLDIQNMKENIQQFADQGGGHQLWQSKTLP